MDKALRYRAWVGVGLLALLALGIWAAVFAEGRPGVLTVAILDVGQGDAIYIKSPSGSEVLIDGGPYGEVLSALATVMQPFDRTLDAVVETHPDADHIGGLVDVLERYTVKNFVEPGTLKDTATYARLEEEVDEGGIPRYLARRGMELDMGGGVVLRVLSPDFDTAALAPDEANMGGIVLQLIYGSTTMLFMADVPSTVEDHLVALDGASLHSGLLKVGHHGSRSSTDDEFLNATAPAVAIISVGEGNRYGHPTQDVLDRLEAHGVAVLRTDEEGTITFISDGKNFLRTR